jgi:hypothetical protein
MVEIQLVDFTELLALIPVHESCTRLSFTSALRELMLICGKFLVVINPSVANRLLISQLIEI